MDTTMELDDLKQAWQSLDARLQAQNTLQLALLHEQRVGRMRAWLQAPALGQAAQVAFGLCLAWTLALPHWSAMRTPLAVAGAIFCAYGVLIAIFGANALVRMARIERDAPVLELQRRMLQLRKALLLSRTVAGLPWCVLWLVPIAATMAIGADAGLAQGTTTWLWLNLAFGCALILGALGFWRWAQRPGREALAGTLRDILTGRGLKRAQAELDALQRYGED